ncbi:MAG: hypothetical protein ABIG61_12480 [Planctomycetota bacterium]
MNSESRKLSELTKELQSTELAKQMRGADWIWGGQDPRKENTYRFFRKEFDLSEVPKSAFIWAYAEAKYKLYVNGTFIQAGPGINWKIPMGERLFTRHVTRKYRRLQYDSV